MSTSAATLVQLLASPTSTLIRHAMRSMRLAVLLPYRGLIKPFETFFHGRARRAWPIGQLDTYRIARLDPLQIIARLNAKTVRNRLGDRYLQFGCDFTHNPYCTKDAVLVKREKRREKVSGREKGREKLAWSL